MAKLGIYGIIGVILLILGTINGGFFITQEGSVTLVKRLGEVNRETAPGLHFKIPYAETTVDLDTRERKSGGSMSVSTFEQMPVTAIITVNWSLDKKDNIPTQFYREYGSIYQFEQNILEPKLLESAKLAVAKFTAEEQLTKRDLVTEAVKTALLQKVQHLPITVSAVQIEEFILPADYLQSISNKQTQKNNADAEKFVLEKQNLTARQKENTAQAEANATLLTAEADAKAIELKGTAEAKAIEAKSKALKDNPLIVELTKAQNWNGSYVTTNIGSGTGVLMDIRENKNVK